MSVEQFNQGLMDFISRSPTPFHAVETMAAALNKAQFQKLYLDQAWSLTSGQRYYVTVNDSSIVAFIYGTTPLMESGVRMIGAHTDSPCLRLKPAPVIMQNGYFQLGVEVYGGVLLAPWFDRDLSLAGRVSFTDTAAMIQHRLVDFAKPLATIPNLAIHLNREVNTSNNINPQKHIPPILMCTNGEVDFNGFLKQQLQRQYDDISIGEILDYELSFYDTQAPAVIGLQNDFIASARLDNLASCYIGLQALLQAGNERSALLVCNDHEEVGSQSAIGAQGPLLKDVLWRLTGGDESYSRTVERSMLISADNAHGIHPNFADKHDNNHGPQLNGGPVIKVNANQRYATNSVTSAIYRQACERAGVPIQTFVTRTDMACGSTIGPITAAVVGVKTLDVGIPTFAMHSIRELAGSCDPNYLYQSLVAYLLLNQT